MPDDPFCEQKRLCVVVNDIGHYFGSRGNGKNRGEGNFVFQDRMNSKRRTGR